MNEICLTPNSRLSRRTESDFGVNSECDFPKHLSWEQLKRRDSPRTYQRPPALAAFRPWGIRRDDTAWGVTAKITRRAMCRRKAVMGNLPYGGFA